MKKKIIPAAVLIITLVGFTLYFEVFRYLGEDSSVISESGTIEVTEINIASKISGRLVDLPKAEGMDVVKGDLVAKLEYEELSAQRHSARASYSNAERNYRRAKSLFETGSISKKEFDNAETAFNVARAGYDQINATIDNAVIFSPIGGVVLNTNLEVGEMAFPGTSILTLADITKPWIHVYVNEKRLGQVMIGQKARVKVDSFPGRSFEGRVVSISNKAEFTPKTIQTRDERVKLVFAVKVTIENPDRSLKPGMPADVDIILPGKGK